MLTSPEQEDNEDGTPFSILWLRQHQRSLEIVFDFATGRKNGYQAWRKKDRKPPTTISLDWILSEGGMRDDPVGDGDVVVMVGVTDEEQAGMDVEALELDLRRKVRLEVVED